MKKITLALTVVAIAAGGTAFAQQHGMLPRGHDPLGDATITRAEAQAKAATLFDKFDANHDGKLDKADREARIGQHFDQMDTNHDGNLSRQEFIAAHEQAMDHLMGPGSDRHGMMGPMGRHMMMGADLIGDRTITRDEFVATALKHFDQADTNHDGKLTKEERRVAMRTHMHGPMGEAPPAPPPHE